MSMLEVMHELIKFPQSCGTFEWDFVQTNEDMLCKYVHVYWDWKKKYNGEKLKDFTNFVDCNNDGLLSSWWTNATINIQHANFYFQGLQY
jgi:hypothetical protein